MDVPTPVISAPDTLAPSAEVEKATIPLRPVTIPDVGIYAKKGCPGCHGEGYLLQRTIGSKEQTPIACGCAQRRFFRKHAGEMISRPTKAGRLEWFWQPGKGPAAEPAE